MNENILQSFKSESAPCIHTWSKLLVPLVNMIKEGSVNKPALLILLIFYFKIFFYPWLELQMALASMVRWNKKMSFLAANTQDGFGEHRDKKKVPHVYNEIYCCIFNVVGLYFCWRSWTSCLDTWYYWFYQIPTDKKINKWLTLLEIL